MENCSIYDFLNAMEKIKIIIDEKELASADFLIKNKAIIIDSLFECEPQRNLILHPCTNIIFYQTLILSAINAFYIDSTNNENILECLMPGDLVIHLTGKRRYKVIEVNHSKGFIMLQGSNGLTNQVPITSKSIKPYYGKAKSLDGRGVRVKGFSGRDFFASMFGFEKDMIKTTIDHSIIVVCQKQEADLLIDTHKLKLNDGNAIRLCELLPCAYYSSASDWVNYAGNSSNIDPVIKFTSKLSVARELVLEDEYKKIQGVIVNGSEYITSGVSELNDLITKRSLHNVIILAPISYGDYSPILEQCQVIKLFAWTNEALLSTIEDLCDIYINDMAYKGIENAYYCIDNMCQKDIDEILIEAPFESDITAKCRQSLFKLKNNMAEGEDKDIFITYGYSLLNLMEQSCFCIDTMEELINSESITAISPSKMLVKLDDIAYKYLIFNDERYEHMQKVIELLSSMKNKIQKSNPKYDYLKNIVLEIANKKNSSIAVVMPKAYHSTVFLSTLSDYARYKVSEIDFVTASKFDMRKKYNKVIVIGVPESKRFNALLLPNSPHVEFIYYKSEQWRVDSLRTHTNKIMDYYDKRNSIKYDYESIEILPIEEMGKHEELDSALGAYVDNIFVKTTSDALNRVMQSGHTLSEVVKFVSFESGEYAFFTKRYLPYRYSQADSSIEETDVESIQVGDLLVFARIEDENKDIVDKVLEKLIDLRKLSKEQESALKKSKYWKAVLRSYMYKNNITFGELADSMLKLGKTKHEATLRTWLDGDSRIVGPRDPESFYSIALLTDDVEMLQDPDGFCEACRIVRSMRIKILRFIGKSIIKSVEGKTDDEFEETLLSLAKDVSQMVKMLQIERIENTNTAIPVYMANRPHYLS